MAAKNNVRAAQFRQQGNELYGRKELTDALWKYNESICWAENDSEDLGIGYANRSVVFLMAREFEFALANIALAKGHNYPQRMMPKLEARERICRQQLSKRKAPSQEYRLEVNPRIPFLGNDVHVEEIANVGRCVVADRDFEPGDVIVQSRLLFGSLDASTQNLNCDNCTSEFFHSLIPCPHCVSVMYCGEDCRQKGWKHFHRFECGITWKLHKICSEIGTGYIGPRIFFYGLSLFHDDVQKMQQFCETQPKRGSNSYNLDYVNCDPIEEFELINTYTMESTSVSQFLVKRSRAAAEEYFKAFQDSALVKSLFATNAAKKFMQRYFLDYTQAFHTNPNSGAKKFICSAVPIIFGINLSTIGNVAMVNTADQLTIVVLQPISKGSQLTLKMLSDSDLSPSLMVNAALDHTSEFPLKEWTALEEMLMDDGTNDTVKITRMHNFLRKYSHMTDLSPFKRVIHLYFNCLEEIHMKQVLNDQRAKVVK